MIARHWPTFAPILGTLVLGLGLALPLAGWLIAIAVIALGAAVFAAVHHAEVIAHRVGEPFGTLILAVAVTVIEVALILSLMLARGPEAATYARDTLYAAVMVIATGVVGVCVLLGGLRHREQSFRVEGTGPALAALVALATFALVLPNHTTSSPSGTFTSSQLGFVALVSFALWAVYVFVQTIRHRDYFLPPDGGPEDSHAQPPTARATWASSALLLVALVGVIGLAKVLSPAIEAAIVRAGAPKAVIGIVIATLVLAPETLAAVRAARADRLQTSMNLALGSALASIGLTVPVVVTAAILFDLPLTLGLANKDVTLLALTLVVSAITLGTGRTHVMQGAVHVVLFAAFLFLSLVP